MRRALKIYIFIWVFFLGSADATSVAITLDDFNLRDHPSMTAIAQNDQVLKVLKDKRIGSALFVSGKYIESAQSIQELKKWDDGKHMIANHSYQHSSVNSIHSEAFEKDLLMAQSLLLPFRNFERWFRFPYLKEGNTKETRDQARSILDQHGYQLGHVTIDASDWYIDERLRKKLLENPDFDKSKFRDFYLNHIWERSVYYDTLAKKVLGRSPKHTLLLHHNLASALFLEDLIVMFQSKKWKVISARNAFKDPVFKKRPSTLPAGESIIWSLAKETGRLESILRYPAEDSAYEEKKMNDLGL